MFVYHVIITVAFFLQETFLAAASDALLAAVLAIPGPTL